MGQDASVSRDKDHALLEDKCRDEVEEVLETETADKTRQTPDRDESVLRSCGHKELETVRHSWQSELGVLVDLGHFDRLETVENLLDQ